MHGNHGWAWGAMPVWQTPHGAATAMPYAATAPGAPGSLPLTPVSPAGVASPGGYMAGVAVPVMLGPGQHMGAAGGMVVARAGAGDVDKNGWSE
jgi:hypothetical protein